MNVNTMKKENVDPRLLTLLDELKPVPTRNTHAAMRGRARFLSEAVSVSEKQRHSMWTIFQQKEQLMMKLTVSTLLIVGLLFGGNATVSAAQNDLPNQPLYQLKLMSEDAHLWFTSNPVQQIEMLMQQAQTRIQEMETLTAQGVMPPAALTVRAQEKIQRALQLAMNLDDPAKIAMLQQLRTRLQTQEQLIEQLQQSNCTQCEPVLRQTRDMLRTQLREVEGDLATPEPAPLQFQNQNQNQYQNQVRTTQTPQPLPTTTKPCGTCTPALDGTGQQNGNMSAATPMQQQNQNRDRNQNGTGSGGGNHDGMGPGGGNQNGTGSGGNGPSSGSGGPGGQP
jgi:flagellin-specific chaperone FliS